ncbi:MAG TPA: tripartite tricarboxylate transporter substrate binding protein [Burkholderiales bacterium]|nr:tripartite tricarboxylate transporter substrate binding protein [Burkholderiales bacterium]
MKFQLVFSILVFAQAASAQIYPAKPIRFIVPWTPGSGTDLMSRMLAQRLAEPLGQQVVVDNRGGAGAIIGTEAAAKSLPDGYTIYVGGSVSMAVSPALYAKVAYDPLKDFAPVCLVSKFFNAVALHPSVPAKSIKELIALSKAKPDELMFASAGSGSTSHLSGELFMNMTGVKWIHVPYKGGGQSITGVLSGEAHMMLAPISTAAPHGKTGRMRVIAVTSARRVASLPDLPTVSEAGVPGFEYGGWQGILVPAGVSPDVIARLNGAILKAINTPEFRAYLQQEGSELVGSTPDAFGAFLREEVVKQARIVRAAGIKPQ